MEENKMISIVESVLFVSGEPIEISKICDVLNIIEYQLEILIDKYNKNSFGLIITKLNNKVQLCTKPEYAEYIQLLANRENRQRLTQPLLETLSIIAYRQPITRQEIEAIRGVNSTTSLNKLVELELIEERDRKDAPGRPILYGTNDAFLRYFNIQSIEELPKYQQLKKDTE
ncbi:MAG: SMC-Scp complex subunit ScpB [Clostridia bacterium]|nr:SMC-Scp complex subunit ScpB [Clostridia bacterium]